MNSTLNKMTVIVAAALLGMAASNSSVYAALPTTPITTPAGLNLGDHFYVVFLSNSAGHATSADVSTYDSIVNGDGALLTYHGAPVNFKALISTADNPATGPNDPVNAIDRFNPASGIGIYLIDGTKVANDGAELWDGSILHGINLTPTGVPAPTGQGAWTGSDPDGQGTTDFNVSHLATAGNSDSGMVSLGDQDGTTFNWTESAWGPEAGYTARYYAFSEELTVPEPASLALLGLGGLALLRRRKQT